MSNCFVIIEVIIEMLINFYFCFVEKVVIRIYNMVLMFLKFEVKINK